MNDGIYFTPNICNTVTVDLRPLSLPVFLDVSWDMKIPIIFALAIAALLNLEAADGSPYHVVRSKRDTDLQVCKPGDRKMEDCNHCHCTNSGWACTRMECPNTLNVALPGEDLTPSGDTIPSKRANREVHGRPGEPGFRCTPSSHFMDDCNECICMANGRHAACTLMACL